MKAVSEGRVGLNSAVFQEQMYQCLNCRACEAVCPSGVEYGKIVEASRAQIEQARGKPVPLPTATPVTETPPPLPWWLRLLRWGVFGGLFAHLSWFRAFSRVLALYQRSGVQWLVRTSGLLRWVGMHEMEAMLPPMSRTFVVPQGQVYPAHGARRFTVALLSGCIMSTAFAHVHGATIRVLQRNGCEVIIPPDQQCCGALHIHSGDLEGGRSLARRNIAAFEGLGVDAVIVNAAGCGSTLKEYGDLLRSDPAWHRRAQRFSRLVKDVNEFLAGMELNRAAMGPLPLHVTYQEPCHLAYAQRITREPRVLLRAIPGLRLREMRESALCCGSAGVYNLTHPEMARQLGERKVSHALDTGVEVIATANPGCALQMAAELRRRGKAVAVRSIVELLDEAYQRGEG
jgi:glycolate oxidase iron-sulfur subunit